MQIEEKKDSNMPSTPPSDCPSDKNKPQKPAPTSKSETAGDNAKKLLLKANKFIEQSGPLPQLAAGAASGWFTGFLATRVGKTAALSVGGSILLVTAATQTGYVNVNWDKLNMKASQATDNASKSVAKGFNHPQATTLRNFARKNTYFAAGFIGGFLIGVCS